MRLKWFQRGHPHSHQMILLALALAATTAGCGPQGPLGVVPGGPLAYGFGYVAGPLDELEGPEQLIPENALLPKLWVDTEDIQVRRIDRASGVFTLFGPIVSFEKLMIPA
ncbi:MAG TPA: hypothetical protein EYQ60_18735 [Myxococcales bacterium]|nr:hypothetical protein [Myxococcales bacterium]HIK83628.1 hypothetical protein [Myxococcales bacterium]